jgi:hypothetical protein
MPYGMIGMTKCGTSRVQLPLQACLKSATHPISHSRTEQRVSEWEHSTLQNLQRRAAPTARTITTLRAQQQNQLAPATSRGSNMWTQLTKLAGTHSRSETAQYTCAVAGNLPMFIHL